MFLENTRNYTEQFDSTKVICRTMFSGKTEEVIKRINVLKLQNILPKYRLSVQKPKIKHITVLEESKMTIR